MSVKYKFVEKVNPLDLTAPRRVYATAVQEKVITMKELARDIATYSTTASEGDVFAVIIIFHDLIRKYLSESGKVYIEGIGRFSISIQSSGAASEAEFHPSMIKGAKILFQPDAEMKLFLAGLKFEKYGVKLKP